MHRDNRSFGNVDLCGNDLVVIDRLVPDLLLLLISTSFDSQNGTDDFRSYQLTHSDMKFDPSVSPPCYRSNDEIIQKDTKVRIQIVGCRVEANDMVSLVFYIQL